MGLFLYVYHHFRFNPFRCSLMFLAFQRLHLGAHHLWQLQPSEQNMSFTPEVWPKCVCVCLITLRWQSSLWGSPASARGHRMKSESAGLALSAALVCLWTWHAVPVKWASLGSPAKGNKSRTMWLAQPCQREPRRGGRQGAKGGAWHAGGQHDSATKRWSGTFGRLFLSQILWLEDRSSSVKCRCLTQLSWSQVFLYCCPSWD